MKHQIESRLIDLALSIDSLCKSLAKSILSNHLSVQIIRSSTSAALNYGEAQSAESKKDFIHKSSLVLKELRETKVCLKLLINSVQKNRIESFKNCQSECDQLIAIFYKTIQSTKQNMINQSK
jgi:four helix bundle protein